MNPTTPPAVQEVEQKRPLTFIDLRDHETGRTSALSVYGRRNEGTLVIVGNLEHHAQIVPNTHADADALIAWLIEWKAQKPA